MTVGVNKRLLVVTGKGGVGRSVVTAALGIAAANAGRTTTTVEFDGLSSVAQLHGLNGRKFDPRVVTPNLDTMSLTVMECLGDFGRRVLKIGALVRVVFQNRIVRALVDGVPGIHDLLQLGKLRNLLAEPLPRDRKYDLAILDAPATGHGLTLLDSGLTMAELTRVGPLHEEANQIEAWLGSSDLTGIVIVTLAERLPVQEALELLDNLGDKRAQVVAVVLNQTQLTSQDVAATDALQDAVRLAGRDDLAGLLDRDRAVAHRQQQAAGVLRNGLEERGLTDVNLIVLPKLRTPVNRSGIQTLAGHMEVFDG
ncbi:MAG: anion-transporting ArsA/GET3 family ATPase [Myxococcota bacterium]